MSPKSLASGRHAWRNWAGTVRCEHARRVQPSEVSAIAEAITRAGEEGLASCRTR